MLSIVYHYFLNEKNFGQIVNILALTLLIVVCMLIAIKQSWKQAPNI